MTKAIRYAGFAVLLCGLPASGPLLADSHGQGHGQEIKHLSGTDRTEAVFARGVVRAVISESRRVRIYHEPIAAWKMDAMQMTFHLAPDVDINALKEGMEIKFMTQSPSVGKYVITRFKDAGAVSARGVVREVIEQSRKVKIYHEPIAAWKNRAMQMTFHLAPDVDIKALTEGEEIHFMATNPSVGKYVLTRLLQR